MLHTNCTWCKEAKALPNSVVTSTRQEDQLDTNRPQAATKVAGDRQPKIQLAAATPAAADPGVELNPPTQRLFQGGAAVASEHSLPAVAARASLYLWDDRAYTSPADRSNEEPDEEMFNQYVQTELVRIFKRATSRYTRPRGASQETSTKAVEARELTSLFIDPKVYGPIAESGLTSDLASEVALLPKTLKLKKYSFRLDRQELLRQVSQNRDPAWVEDYLYSLSHP